MLKNPCAVWASALLVVGAAHATTLDKAIADLSAPAQAKVKASVGSFLRIEVKSDRAPSDLGWDCMAAATLVDLGVEGAKARLTAIATELQADVSRSKRSNKAIGWPAPADVAKACVATGSRKTTYCDGASTTYAFQSGLGMACLARAGRLLSRPEYTAMASDAMAYWDGLRMPKSSCDDCTFFAMSDSAVDDERYVRNMNLFVALGATELSRTLGDANLRTTACKAINADISERSRGNMGYLGRSDPLWAARQGEAERIENHSAIMSVMVRSMGQLLTDGATQSHALTIYRDWANCDNKRCQTLGCRYWAGNPQTCQATATTAHCAFRLQDREAAGLCEELLSVVPSVGSFGLWSTLIAK